MTRTADSSIKGFLYQFNKTLLSILRANDGESITVEGLIEDIDIVAETGGIKAVQCKYHESKETYTNSLIFKPLLQMAETYCKRPNEDISFIIFLFIPSESPQVIELDSETLEAALTTKNQSLSKIAERIKDRLDSLGFLKKVRIEFGPSIDELEEQVKEQLNELDIKGADTECLLYPNAINKVAKLSSLKSELDRRITKEALSNELSQSTFTVVTKWSLALKSRKAILDITRKQLLDALGQNNRLRCFYFSASDVKDFEDRIVVFIKNYLSKYHSKAVHLQTPIFAIDCDIETIEELVFRLHKKEIKANTGIVGRRFENEHFYREPMRKTQRAKVVEREFDLRLLAAESFIEALNYKRCDELYFICNAITDSIDTYDTNIHQIATECISELEYVLNIRKTHE